MYPTNKLFPFILFVQKYIDPAYEQGGSNMTGTELCVNKPHFAAAVRP